MEQLCGNTKDELDVWVPAPVRDELLDGSAGNATDDSTKARWEELVSVP
jgi:hypothetical protein